MRRRGIVVGLISTALSAVGLIGLALFEQYNGMLSELRSDLKHFNEVSGEYVKKDRLQRCWETVRDCSKEMSASNGSRALLEEKLKASEKTADDLNRELRLIRERLAYLEGLRARSPGISSDRRARQDVRDPD